MSAIISPRIETLWAPNPGPQTYFLQCTAKELLFGGSAGGGKCLNINTIQKTSMGWKTLGEIQPGDSLLDENHKPCLVLAVSEVMFNHPCFEVTFVCGDETETIVADDQHLWPIRKSRGTKCIRTKDLIPGSRLIGEKVWMFKCKKETSSVPVKCIAVNSPSNCYLAGKGLVPTHNSDGLLVRAAVYAQPHPSNAKKKWDPSQNRAIILRRTFPMLHDLIRRSQELYLPLGATYNGGDKCWTFPTGGTVRFGYLERYEDVHQYQGQAFTAVLWDELTQMPSDEEYLYMFSRLRARVDAGIPLQSIATCNPGGVGHRWVQRRWSIPPDGAADKKPITTIDPKMGHRRVFIPSRVTDNPHLGVEYLDNLELLPEATKNALKHGRWDTFEGSMFNNFIPHIHTRSKFLIPYSWMRWRGGDDGYSEPSAIYWLTKDPRTGIKYVYQELYRSGLTADKLAMTVLEMDKEGICSDDDPNQVVEGQNLSGIYDSAAWADTGLGNSAGEGRAQIMNRLGAGWTKCTKGPGSRVAGVNLLNQHLTLDPKTPEFPHGKPRLIIFNNCINLIETLPRMVRSKADPEDIVQVDDHAYDGLRYGLQYASVRSGFIKVRGI